MRCQSFPPDASRQEHCPPFPNPRRFSENPKGRCGSALRAQKIATETPSSGRASCWALSLGRPCLGLSDPRRTPDKKPEASCVISPGLRNRDRAQLHTATTLLSQILEWPLHDSSRGGTPPWALLVQLGFYAWLCSPQPGASRPVSRRLERSAGRARVLCSGNRPAARSA